MIITRTPFRISFVGGGSDLPSFYHYHEGAVISTTINKYMYISIHPSFSPKKTILKYNKTEIVDDIKKLEHPIARQLLLDHGLRGCEITSTADIPSGTGLSTSSAYTVGLIHAIYAYLGKYISQERIAREACITEIEKLGEPIGKQDQYGTAIGGLKLIRFLPDNSVDIEPVLIDKKRINILNDNLILFYTGLTHNAGKILKEQSKEIQNQKEKFDNLIQMTKLVYKMRETLSNGNIDDIGVLLHENWLLKKKLTSSISNKDIDDYYQVALDNGAIGGKLLGAGGGGFLLFYCPKKLQTKLKKALSDLTPFPFEIENSGTKVIYVGEKNW